MDICNGTNTRRGYKTKLDTKPLIVLTIIESSVLFHHLDSAHALCSMEWLRRCVRCIEFAQPLATEEGRIGQDQLRCRRNVAGQQDVTDMLSGHLFDEFVDVLAAAFRVFGKVQRLDNFTQLILKWFSARCRTIIRVLPGNNGEDVKKLLEN